MGSNCTPLVADLFLFCYEGDFLLSLSGMNQADVVEAFNSNSRYLDDLLNIRFKVRKSVKRVHFTTLNHQLKGWMTCLNIMKNPPD